MKQIFILLPILFLSNYSIANEMTNCPPEKNYKRVNRDSIDKYKQDYIDNKINSVFYDYSELNQNYNTVSNLVSDHKLSFVEKKLKLNNDEDYSLYKIESFKKGSKECNYTGKSNDDYCYRLKKIDSIESKYSLVYKKISETSFDVKFTNLTNNDVIYDYAYTIYRRTPTSVGWSWCQLDPSLSYEDAIINISKFPLDPLFRP